MELAIKIACFYGVLIPLVCGFFAVGAGPVQDEPQC